MSSQENLTEYQKNYLNYRNQKTLEIKQNYENEYKLYTQQLYNNARSFEDYLHFQFGQGNSKQLKRRFNQNPNDLHNIYDWLRNNSRRR